MKDLQSISYRVCPDAEQGEDEAYDEAVHLVLREVNVVFDKVMRQVWKL